MRVSIFRHSPFLQQADPAFLRTFTLKQPAFIRVMKRMPALPSLPAPQAIRRISLVLLFSTCAGLTGCTLDPGNGHSSSTYLGSSFDDAVYWDPDLAQDRKESHKHESSSDSHRHSSSSNSDRGSSRSDDSSRHSSSSSHDSGHSRDSSDSRSDSKSSDSDSSSKSGHESDSGVGRSR